MSKLTAPKPGSLIALVLLALTCVPVVAEEGDAPALVAFAYGVRAFNEGRDQEARQELTQVLELQPRNGTAHYWLGLTLLRLDQPAEALAEIQRSLKDRATLQVDPLWARHDLGRAQLAAGKTEDAVRTLTDVVHDVQARLKSTARAAAADDPDEEEARRDSRSTDETLLARAFLLQAEALARLDRPTEATAARGQAEALKPGMSEPEIVAPPWGGELPALGVSARSWDASVSLATFGDSNPSLLSEHLSLDTPDVGIDLVSGGESDEALQLDLQLGFHPLRSFGGWRLGAAFEGRQSHYQDLGFFDTGELQGITYAAHGGAPLGSLTGPLGTVRVERDEERRLSFLVQGGLGYTTLDGRGYLTTAEASTSAVYRPSRHWAGQVDFHVLDRSYREEPAVGRRSGTEVRLGLSQTFTPGAPDRWLRLEVLGGRRSAGLPFESSLLRGTAELSFPLPNRALILGLRGSWQKDDYDNPESDLFFLPYDPFKPEFGELKATPDRRADTTLRAGASLSWTVRPSLQLATRLGWTDRSSNLGTSFVTLDYRRTLVSLGATWLF